MNNNVKLINLYKEALKSYKLYVIVSPDLPSNIIVLKWPDIAESAIRSIADCDYLNILITDLETMIVEPINIILECFLQKFKKIFNKEPTYIVEKIAVYNNIKDVVVKRDRLIECIKELISSISTVENIPYASLIN